MAKSHSSFDSTVVDAASLFDASEVIAERLSRSKITIDYSKLSKCLASLRADDGWRPASLNTILLSMDPSSEGQQRFQAMLGHSGFEPDVIHYRDTFVSVPPGRSPSEMGSKPIKSLASRIAYIAGLMARYTAPQFLVVSHSYELYGPLTDLCNRVPKGKVGIAYFGSLLDYRWKATGLFDSNLGLKFFDLDPHGEELLGVDLAGRPSMSADTSTGLSRF